MSNAVIPSVAKSAQYVVGSFRYYAACLQQQ